MDKLKSILSSMPKVLVWVFVALALFGFIPLYGAYKFGETSHEGLWTSFLLHVVAEVWGFAFGIVVAFLIGVNLANEKIKPVVRLIAKLRREKIITGTTARGLVICAAKLLSEEQLTKDLTVSIVQRPQFCDVCAFDIASREDRKCPHCGLEDIAWKIPADSSEY